MEKEIIKAVSEVVVSVYDSKNIRRAVKFLSKNLTVRATKKIFRGKVRRNDIDIVLSIGAPNYKERQLLKNYKDSIIGLVRTTELRTPKK